MKYHLRRAVPEVHIIFRSNFTYLIEPFAVFLSDYHRSWYVDRIACTKGYLGVNIEFFQGGKRQTKNNSKMDSLKCRSPSIVKESYLKIALLNNSTYKSMPIHQLSYMAVDPSESFIVI